MGVRLEKLNSDESLLDVKPIGISKDFVFPKPCCPVTRGRENAIFFLDKLSVSIKSVPNNRLPIHEFSSTGDYLSGAFWALDAFNQCWSAFSATDLGQYPWGKNPKKVWLSEIYDFLGIKTSDNVSNCCLFIHLLTAALDKNLISMKSLLHRNYDRFLRNYLTSNIMRVDEIVVPDFLYILNLQDKIFVEMLFLHSDGFFYFCDPSKKFGNPNSATGIFIAFCRNHFFLVNPLKILVQVIFS